MGLLDTLSTVLGKEAKGTIIDQIIKVLSENAKNIDIKQITDMLKDIDLTKAQNIWEHIQKNGVPKDAAGATKLIGMISDLKAQPKQAQKK